MITKQPAVKRYIVTLSAEEREHLDTLIQKGTSPARQVLKARILLKSDASDAGDAWSDSQIATALDTSIDTVARTRQQLVEEGLEAALTRKHSPASARPRIFDGAAEAKLIALACSEPPKGRAVVAEAAGRGGGRAEHRCPRQRQYDRANAQKNILKPHLQKQWVIPPDANAAFVAGMEDVLEVYHRPHDPAFPVVCLDETSKQLVAETRVPIAAKPGHPARHDYEYQRNGTANLFMLFAPLEGWRHVEVTDRRTARDYAQVLKDLSDTHLPAAKKIVLVQDNLSTHKPASLYEAFPAAEARRLTERFEWHYTPKHGSWLDMAKSELSVLSVQCLDRRISDRQTLIEEVAAWQDCRNKKHTTADWHFTTADARVKLKRLYPAI